MWKPFLFSALVLAGAMTPLLGDSQAPPVTAAPAAASGEFRIPPESASQVNPVKASADSLSRGKKVFGYECAACHGDDGAGTGDLAKKMKAKMPDFRNADSLQGRTDGAIFYIIVSGKGEMEGEGPRLKPEDTWNLVNYIRSISKGGAPS